MATNLLKTLTLTAAPTRGDPVAQRREKLISHINDQICLVRDRSFQRVERKRQKDESGAKRLVEVTRPVHPWWTEHPELRDHAPDRSLREPSRRAGTR